MKLLIHIHLVAASKKGIMGQAGEMLFKHSCVALLYRKN